MLRLPDTLLSQLLAEDVPHGDLTTHLLGVKDAPARMSFAARGHMVVACVEEAARIIELAGGSVLLHCRSGDSLPDRSPILEADGPAEALLAAWKVAQNLVESASGIAGAVRAMVEAAQKGGGASVACTRKSFPGTRAIALKAVAAGGGVAHRLGLSDSILVFPEHRAFLQGDLSAHMLRLRREVPEKKLVAEVCSRDEALILADAGVDVLQLEKFPPQEVAELALALRMMGQPPVLAVAGGVNPGNAEAYVRAGAQVLVTSAPYWAKPSDVQVRIYPA